jgi:hypothetical protein
MPPRYKPALQATSYNFSKFFNRSILPNYQYIRFLGKNYRVGAVQISPQTPVANDANVVWAWKKRHFNGGAVARRIQTTWGSI